MYDVICIGGGLAGLSLSIPLAKAGLKVAVIEKKSYPFHKVCGEYISLESWNFLNRLGLELDKADLPIIKVLNLTTDKTIAKAPLPLGGFGLSRYQLDHQLYQIAIENGVEVMTHTTFKKHENADDGSKIITTDKGICQTKILIASNGKITAGNLFNAQKEQINYFAVKYHVKNSLPKDLISLHVFEGGYLGTNAIENNHACICYMTNSEQLKQHKSLEQLQENILFRNKNIKSLFEQSEFVWQQPVTISNIYFGKRVLHHDGVIYMGDSAGAIPPLAGNGMSLAFRTANLLTQLLISHFENKGETKHLISKYEKEWNQNFAGRIKKGKLLQPLFLNENLSNTAFRIFNWAKPLQSWLIRQTHGTKF